jgi:hypothetical protein
LVCEKFIRSSSNEAFNPSSENPRLPFINEGNAQIQFFIFGHFLAPISFIKNSSFKGNILEIIC